ncbi:hypothetical protein LJK88_09405 [Paenibacillus sp. P26]|nr:hypothetical protein LJK88_09405 [Paenibacillus sp. P26]
MKKWFYRLSLRRRLWISFLLLTVFSIALTGVVSYWIAYQSTEKEAFLSSQNTMNKSARVLDEKLRHIVVTTSAMMLSDSFKKSMYDVFADNSGSYYTSLSSLQTPFAQMKLSEPSIQSILIYTPIGEFYATNDLRSSQVPFKSTMFSRYLDGIDRVVWVEGHDDPLFLGNPRVISLLMKPISEVNVHDVYVVVNLKEDAIRKVMTDDLLDNAGSYFLINRSGGAVCRWIRRRLPFRAIRPFAAASGAGPRIFQVRHERRILSGQLFAADDGRGLDDGQCPGPVGSAPALNAIKTTSLVIMLCCVVLALFLSNLLSGLLLKPLHKAAGADEAGGAEPPGRQVPKQVRGRGRPGGPQV